MWNSIKDRLKIGQKETLFYIKLRKIVLILISLECLYLLISECLTAIIYINNWKHVQANSILNETFRVTVLIEAGSKLYFKFKKHSL